MSHVSPSTPPPSFLISARPLGEGLSQSGNTPCGNSTRHKKKSKTAEESREQGGVFTCSSASVASSKEKRTDGNQNLDSNLRLQARAFLGAGIKVVTSKTAEPNNLVRNLS